MSQLKPMIGVTFGDIGSGPFTLYNIGVRNSSLVDAPKSQMFSKVALSNGQPNYLYLTILNGRISNLKFQYELSNETTTKYVRWLVPKFTDGKLKL